MVRRLGRSRSRNRLARRVLPPLRLWHVEFDCHEILLAENMPAESYLDVGNRQFFENSDVVALDAAPDTAIREKAGFCRPFHEGGPVVAEIRRRLDARAKALGWTLGASDAFAGLHLVVDGRRVDPVTRELSARFHIRADAQDVWLVSSSARPCDTETGSLDERELGVCLRGITIDDGFAVHPIDLADPCLRVGLHNLEDGLHRWTAGRTYLPAALWAGSADSVFLRFDLAVPALARWTAPPHAARARCLSQQDAA